MHASHAALKCNLKEPGERCICIPNNFGCRRRRSAQLRHRACPPRGSRRSAMPGLMAMLKKLKKTDDDCKILVLGLDNAGKTTILRQLGKEDLSQARPPQ